MVQNLTGDIVVLWVVLFVDARLSWIQSDDKLQWSRLLVLLLSSESHR